MYLGDFIHSFQFIIVSRSKYTILAIGLLQGSLIQRFGNYMKLVAFGELEWKVRVNWGVLSMHRESTRV